MTVDGHACWYLCPSKTFQPYQCLPTPMQHVFTWTSQTLSMCRHFQFSTHILMFFWNISTSRFYSKVYSTCHFAPQKLTCLVLPLCLCAWLCSSCPHQCGGCCASCLSRWRSGTPWGTKRGFPSLGALGRMAGWWLQSSPKLSTPSLTRDLTWDLTSAWQTCPDRRGTSECLTVVSTWRFLYLFRLFWFFFCLLCWLVFSSCPLPNTALALLLSLSGETGKVMG